MSQRKRHHREFVRQVCREVSQKAQHIARLCNWEEDSASEEGGSSTSGAEGSQLSSLLPQALSSGVMNAGGLGLAAQMTRALEGVHGAAHTRASGGTAS